MRQELPVLPPPGNFAWRCIFLPLVCLGFTSSLAAALCDFLCLKPAQASLCCTRTDCNVPCFPGKCWQEIHNLSASLSCFLLRPELSQWPLQMFWTEFNSQDLPPAVPKCYTEELGLFQVFLLELQATDPTWLCVEQYPSYQHPSPKKGFKAAQINRIKASSFLHHAFFPPESLSGLAARQIISISWFSSIYFIVFPCQVQVLPKADPF